MNPPDQLWIAVGEFPDGTFTYKVAETLEAAAMMLCESYDNAFLVQAHSYTLNPDVVYL
jgi:hypothetical protein